MVCSITVRFSLLFITSIKLTGYIQYILKISTEVLLSDISHAKGVVSIVFVYIKTVNHMQGKH